MIFKKMSGAPHSIGGRPLVSPSLETGSQRGDLACLMSHKQLGADQELAQAPPTASCYLQTQRV